MKAAYEQYFQKQRQYCLEQYGSPPKVMRTDDIDPALIRSAPDEDDEVVWAPALRQEWQSPDLPFALNAEMKLFYGTYLYARLSGEYGDWRFYFDGLPSEGKIPAIIKRQSDDGRYYFPGRQVLVLGEAENEGDDSWLICYDNESAAVFCYRPEDAAQKGLGLSLAELIAAMEALD
ncbi:MAG: hypothetical protein LBK56_09570 [Gracilibacteraceae bacterium]|jgi:hypothetical protein|nr:hypothetical protein [Gracilibacteraceae bacterium]